MSKRTSITRTRKRRSTKSDVPLAVEPSRKPEETTHRSTVHGILQRRASGEAHVPCIRIVGKWLEALGFANGDRLTIETQPGELRILKASGK